MEPITRNARQCSEATNAGFAQNSYRRATVGPRSFGECVGQRSLGVGSARRRWAALGSCAQLGRVATARALNVKKHGGFERRRTNPALLETIAPLETLCALVRDQCS